MFWFLELIYICIFRPICCHIIELLGDGSFLISQHKDKITAGNSIKSCFEINILWYAKISV
jgi:hypothetical protein